MSHHSFFRWLLSFLSLHLYLYLSLISFLSLFLSHTLSLYLSFLFCFFFLSIAHTHSFSPFSLSVPLSLSLFLSFFLSFSLSPPPLCPSLFLLFSDKSLLKLQLRDILWLVSITPPRGKFILKRWHQLAFIVHWISWRHLLLKSHKTRIAHTLCLPLSFSFSFSFIFLLYLLFLSFFLSLSLSPSLCLFAAGHRGTDIADGRKKTTEFHGRSVRTYREILNDKWLWFPFLSKTPHCNSSTAEDM